MPASSLAVTVAALGAHQQAHRHASHRTGHHNGNRRTTTRREHADIEHDNRSGGHARERHQHHARVHRRHASAHALPHPRARYPSCTCARPDNMRSRHVSPVTCAPVGGQHAAHCMAACPPPPRGAVRVRGGVVPRPSTPSCAGTSNCRHGCTSCQSTFGCGRAAVRYLPSHISCQGKFAAPPVGDEYAGP